MPFKSGKNGRVTLGIWTQKTKRWSVRPRNQLQDVTNGESGGFGEYIPGVSDLDFEIELDHFVGGNQFATAFIPGTTFTAVLYVDGIAQPNWSINGIVEDVSETLDVRGLVSITMRGRATSISGTAWTAPTT